MSKGLRHKQIRKINNQPKIQVNLADCPFYKCPKCEKEAAFDRVEMIKVISRILTGQPHDSYVATKMYRCIDCGYVMCHAGEPTPGK